MQKAAPRLLIAGTNSGCGKTTVTCAILQALVDGGVSVAAAKCGPDYIDPTFHREIIGAKSSNLDPFFFDDDTLRFLLAQNGAGKDVTVIEGVMGYYDGIGLDSSRASTFEVAQRTESPVVLVLNAKGAGLSVLAVLDGFLHFAPENRIRGVILNGCTAMSYPTLARAIEECFGVRACGFLPQMPDCSLESRHLGLITAAEVDDLKEKMQRLAAKAQETIDLNALLQIAKSAPPLTFTPPDIPVAGEHVRIGVARDRAFCFYYEDSLELLRRLGVGHEAVRLTAEAREDRLVDARLRHLCIGDNIAAVFECGDALLHRVGGKRERIGIVKVRRRVDHALDDKLVFRRKHPVAQKLGDDRKAALFNFHRLHRFAHGGVSPFGRQQQSAPRRRCLHKSGSADSLRRAFRPHRRSASSCR